MSKQRNILASFRFAEDAKKAAQELHQIGVTETQIDQIGMYPGMDVNNTVNPITGGFDSLSDLTLGSFTNETAEILGATDVSASGMSDGNELEINQNILLTVVTDEANAKQAENIINKYNGEA